jgi:hypothetical protein
MGKSRGPIDGSEPAGRAGVPRRAIEKAAVDTRTELAAPPLSATVVDQDGSLVLPRVLKAAPLRIGEISIDCAVLDDGTRLLTQRGMFVAMGRHKNPTRGQASIDNMPAFLAAKNLESFISEDLRRMWAPVPFLSRGGYRGNIAFGYRAEILPLVCNVYLDALAADALHPNQRPIAERARVLIRGLSAVGIIALIDEATGYQELRERDELRKILAKYISPELLPWTLHFPHEFYEQMFRLWGWHYNAMSLKRPKLVGKLTAKLVYERMPPGVLEELRKKNPANEAGNRKYKHHQFLTGDIGDPHLRQQVNMVTMLMKISPNRRTFERNFARAFPPPMIQLPLLPEAEDDEGPEEEPLSRAGGILQLHATRKRTLGDVWAASDAPEGH